MKYRLARCSALGVGPSFKLAEALEDRGIPFVFTTSYDAEVTRVGYAGVDREARGSTAVPWGSSLT